jgi:endonuclease G
MKKRGAIGASLTVLLVACMTAPTVQKKWPAAVSGTAPVRGETQAGKNILKLDYAGFTVWLDCAKRGPVKFRYNAQHDTGSEARAASFRLDPQVPPECQQFSAATYGNGYDRGHQVPPNHLDASAEAIRQSNYMTNILPQVAQMNWGLGC